MKQVNSTNQFYDCMVGISEHFNRRLFDGNLSSPLLTLKHGSKSLAHFVATNWHGPSGDAVGEICLNPALFAQHSWLRLLQCVSEQLCHHWQHLHGTPSRPGYHNREWADKLEEIGLMPSSTGTPGGRRTGQVMCSYPIIDGQFIIACEELVRSNLRPPLTGRWTEYPTLNVPTPLKLSRKAARSLLAPVGIWSDVVDAKNAIENRESKRKLKYSCPRCGANVWGRPGLSLGCHSCNLRMRETPTMATHTHRPAHETLAS